MDGLWLRAGSALAGLLVLRQLVFGGFARMGWAARLLGFCLAAALLAPAAPLAAAQPWLAAVALLLALAPSGRVLAGAAARGVRAQLMGSAWFRAGAVRQVPASEGWALAAGDGARRAASLAAVEAPGGEPHGPGRERPPTVVLVRALAGPPSALGALVRPEGEVPRHFERVGPRVALVGDDLVRLALVEPDGVGETGGRVACLVPAEPLASLFVFAEAGAESHFIQLLSPRLRERLALAASAGGPTFEVALTPTSVVVVTAARPGEGLREALAVADGLAEAAAAAGPRQRPLPAPPALESFEGATPAALGDRLGEVMAAALDACRWRELDRCAGAIAVLEGQAVLRSGAALGLVTALRCAWHARRCDRAGLAAAWGGCGGAMGSDVGRALAVAALAASCGVSLETPTVPPFEDPAAFAELARALAGLNVASSVLGVSLWLPLAWEEALVRACDRRPSTLDEGHLRQVALAALAWDLAELGYAASGAGLSLPGADAARFLLLRARSLPEHERARRARCAAAAGDWAEEHDDEDLLVSAEDLLDELEVEEDPLEGVSGAWPAVVEREAAALEYPWPRAREDGYGQGNLVPFPHERVRSRPSGSKPKGGGGGSDGGK